MGKEYRFLKRKNYLCPKIKAMQKQVILLVLCWFVLACSSRSSDSVVLEEMATSPMNNTMVQEGGAAAVDASMKEYTTTPTTINEMNPGSQLIKNIKYYFQVEDVDKTAAAIQLAVTNNKGYISGSNFSTESGVKRYTMTVRVPSAALPLLEQAIGDQTVYLNYRTATTEDVTQEYIDIETRLKTKKEVMARYVNVLRNQAKNVKDVLEAENQIRVLQEEIEVQEGRLRYLKNQVSYSTIQLEFYQESTIKSDPNVIKRSFFSDIIDAFVNGWNGILHLIVGLVALWPLLIIFTVIVLLLRRFYKRWKK